MASMVMTHPFGRVALVVCIIKRKGPPLSVGTQLGRKVHKMSSRVGSISIFSWQQSAQKKSCFAMASMVMTHPFGRVALVVCRINRTGCPLSAWAQLCHYNNKWHPMALLPSFVSSQNNFWNCRHVGWKPTGLPIFFAQPLGYVSNRLHAIAFTV